MPLALRTALVAATTTTANVTAANSTTTGSGETSIDLLNDRLDLISATTLVGFSYGVIFCLYGLVTYFLIKRLYRHNSRAGSQPRSFSSSRTMRCRTVFYITYTSVLFVLATLYTAGNSQNTIVAYVDNRLYPGGPYQFYISYMAGEKVMVMTDLSSLIILWMTDGLILGRFIVFYRDVAYAGWMILVLFAMYLGVIVLSALLLQAEAGLGEIYLFSEKLLLSYYVLSFSLCVIATMLITARLYWHKVRLQRVFGRKMDTPYMSIATVLIESASVYAVWSIVFFVLYILQSPGQTVILATMPHVQAIAPLLIILWIARGKAWNKGKSLSEDNCTVPDQNPASSIGRFSFCSPPTRVEAKFGSVNGVHLSESRNTSWSTVGGGRAEHGDSNVDVIELGLYGSKPSSVIGNVKA
ncbi:hypothetical protein J3R82DRAFT_9194 [Butyriboletus roseoflavus]|nr:hypothetical protein J3R82DRAFT_9194 [Butyriboletus roseoflavus]